MIGHNYRYILVDKVPQVEPGLTKWVMWFENFAVQIAKGEIEPDGV